MRPALLVLLLAGCATPPDRHAGPVTGHAEVAGLQFSCSQAGLFVGAGGSETFVCRLPLRPFALAGHPGDDGSAPFLLVGGGDPARSGELALLDLRGGVLAQQRVAGDLVYAVAITPDGREAAAALADGRVLLVTLPELRPVRVAHEHARPAVAVAWSPDGGSIASGGLDGKVLWSARDGGRAPLVIVDHTAPVTCVAFAADSMRLASGAQDAKIRLHDRSGRRLHTWARLGGPIAEVSFDRNALEFVTNIGPQRDAVRGRLPLP